MKRISMTKAASILALVLCVAVQSQAQDMDARLAAFFKQHLEDAMRVQPVEATRLGDHRYDALMDNLTPESRAVWQDMSRRALDELPRQITYLKLSRSAQIDYEIYQHSLNYGKWLEENTHPFETDPRVYGDYITDGTYLLLTQSTLPLEQNVSNCLARMALIPKITAAARANLRNPPRVMTETAISQNQGAIDFYRGGIFALAGHTRQMAALRTASASVVTTLNDYQRFLRNDLLPRANGEWQLGPDKFAHKLDLELDSGMTSDQVLADAESEFARVSRDMYVIARQLWSRYYPRQPLPPDDDPGRLETVRRVLDAIGQDHATAQTVPIEMKERVMRLKKFIKDHDYLDLPEPDRVQVVVMPEFRRGNTTAYLEPPPPLDPNAIGHLAISPPPADWTPVQVNGYFEEYNNHLLDILAIHEGYPGHAVQLQYANRSASLIRRVLSSGVYVEGWAVYNEQALLDAGYGNGDLALRLSQQKFYLRSVANAILDHKMHCGTITENGALDFLTHQCFQTESEAKLKIVRARQSSGQLSTYFVGRMAFHNLRQEVERQLGDKFSLRRFNDAVLNTGGVPVKYLPELVRSEMGVPR
jgi:uncharacterized protein (DUF885 family)